MRVLVTGSSGPLGHGLVQTLRERRHEVIGLELLEPPFYPTTPNMEKLGALAAKYWIEILGPPPE